MYYSITLLFLLLLLFATAGPTFFCVEQHGTAVNEPRTEHTRLYL